MICKNCKKALSDTDVIKKHLLMLNRVLVASRQESSDIQQWVKMRKRSIRDTNVIIKDMRRVEDFSKQANNIVRSLYKRLQRQNSYKGVFRLLPMSDFCTCGQQKTLELDYEVQNDYEEDEEVLPPTDDAEKAEEEEVEEEVMEEPDEEEELLEEGKSYERKDMDKLTGLLEQALSYLKETGGEEKQEMPLEEEEAPLEEELPMEEPMLEEEEEVAMSVKDALKTLEKAGMSVYAGDKRTPATRRVAREKPVAINWAEFSKSVEEIDRMAERAGAN